MKRSNGILKTVIAIMLTIAIAFTLDGHTPVLAAGDNTKAVYSVKQLKKALKAKAASTIIFRTTSYDTITIPSVKAAKNKNLIIDAAYANIKNKAKCKTITVNNINKYTEAVSGNTIIWKDYENNNLVVAKKKTVNKLTFKYWMGLDPEYIIRNGAKIKSISFENTSTASSYNSKTRTLTIDYLDPNYSNNASIYKFDKSGRIIESEHNYVDESTHAYYKYDKNGNNIEYSNNYASGFTYGTQYEYDKNDRIVKTESFSNNSVSNRSYYEYDTDGNVLCYKIENPYGSVLYDYDSKYDKKGRKIEEIEANLNQKFTCKYDSAGRCTETHSITSNEDVFTTYKYNKNGLITEKTDAIKGYGTSTETYVYDFLGNHIYSIIDTVDEDGNHDNSNRTAYYYNEFAGEYPIYEDGYVSPVNYDYIDKEALEKQGYKVVSSVEDFVKAIAPGAKIIIDSYYFNMSDCFEYDDPSVFENEYVILQHNGVDGHELVIYDCDDLLICGASEYRNASTLVIDPRYSAVIRFEECDNLKLDSFTCGHTDMGTCEGNVIDLYNCNNVSFYNMDMFGCGVYGIGVDGVSGNIKVYNSVIHDCYYGAFCFVTLNGDVSFNECVFYGSEGGGYWSGFNDGVKITFRNCSFDEGETNNLFYQEQFTFKDCLWSEITRYPEYGY